MRVGIIGAGQLGQMLGRAGKRLDLTCTYLDPAAQPPARIVGPVLKYPFDSEAGLEQLASNVDVLTYEFENVSVEAIDKIADKTAVYPPTEALRIAQDRLNEKRLFEELAIPVAAYAPIESLAELREVARSIGLPLVLKTRRLGYDGKGQQPIHDEADTGPAWQALGGRPLLAEQWIPFDREVSAIGARSTNGEVALYPITENRHCDGILRTSCAPLTSEAIADQAGRYLRRLLERLQYVGVLALEFFVQGNRLFANEFAPRVHNSGHWTIEGAVTSQFENHLRAILDLPLGDTSAVAHAGMINLIGTMPATLTGDERLHLHDYGKKPRPGRKLGHITVLADSARARDAKLAEIGEILTG
ncbi:MAG: 5-(carboxyamino)imidazole ribonucleotide synthase [Woeseiaceae bacterium]